MSGYHVRITGKNVHGATFDSGDLTDPQLAFEYALRTPHILPGQHEGPSPGGFESCGPASQPPRKPQPATVQIEVRKQGHLSGEPQTYEHYVPDGTFESKRALLEAAAGFVKDDSGEPHRCFGMATSGNKVTLDVFIGPGRIGYLGQAVLTLPEILRQASA